MKYVNDALLSRAKNIVNSFHRDNTTYIDILVRSSPTRYVLYVIYLALTRDGVIISVDKLGKEEKDKLKYYTIEYANGRLDVKQAVELSKALYTLEYLLR